MSLPKAEYTDAHAQSLMTTVTIKGEEHPYSIATYMGIAVRLPGGEDYAMLHWGAVVHHLPRLLADSPKACADIAALLP
jgi:hypothetical protein